MPTATGAPPSLTRRQAESTAKIDRRDDAATQIEQARHLRRRKWDPREPARHEHVAHPLQPQGRTAGAPVTTVTKPSVACSRSSSSASCRRPPLPATVLKRAHQHLPVELADIADKSRCPAHARSAAGSSGTRARSAESCSQVGSALMRSASAMPSMPGMSRSEMMRSKLAPCPSAPGPRPPKPPA